MVHGITDTIAIVVTIRNKDTLTYSQIIIPLDITSNVAFCTGRRANNVYALARIIFITSIWNTITICIIIVISTDTIIVFITESIAVDIEIIYGNTFTGTVEFTTNDAFVSVRLNDCGITRTVKFILDVDA